MSITITNRWTGQVIVELDGADLSGADLRGADLRGADLRGADLRGADLTPIRDDIWAVLSSAPKEVATLLTKIEAGQIDGSCYSGECCCLVGTIAKAQACDVNAIPGLEMDSSRHAERWFMLLAPGDTPATSEPARITHEWVKDWLDRMTAAFSK